MNTLVESSKSTPLKTKKKQFYLVITMFKTKMEEVESTLKWWDVYTSKAKAEEHKKDFLADLGEGYDKKAYIIPLDRDKIEKTLLE